MVSGGSGSNYLHPVLSVKVQSCPPLSALPEHPPPKGNQVAADILQPWLEGVEMGSRE